MQHTFVVEYFPYNAESSSVVEEALKLPYVVEAKEGRLIMVTVEADSYEEGRQRLKRLEKRCSAKVTSGYAEPSKNRKPRKRRVEMHYGRREWHNTQQGCASKIGSGKPTASCFGSASCCFLS